MSHYLLTMILYFLSLYYKMSCINTCLIGSGFLGSSILTMLASKKSKNFVEFNNV